MAENQDDVYPAGLESLYTICDEFYPDQQNSDQLSSLVKYWMGGPDPLDHISMYTNPGIPEKNIPPHWHYISFGLSDLYGDGRVHDITGPGDESGFGFELTFRLKKETTQTEPPRWPAKLLNSLAKYVFQSGSTFRATDHVTWRGPLDGGQSLICHMLMVDDPQFYMLHTPFGTVKFVQIIGVMKEELEAAQQWNCAGLLDILRRIPAAGGAWHVTDMRREQSIFQLDPNVHDEIGRGFDVSGSNLGSVNARCHWDEVDATWFEQQTREQQGTVSDDPPEVQPGTSQSEQTGASSTSETVAKSSGDQPGTSQSDQTGASATLKTLAKPPEINPFELLSPNHLWGVHLKFDLEASKLLPLAIRGRVRHGKNFTFKSMFLNKSITLVGDGATSSQANQDRPYVIQDSILQVHITDALAEDMVVRFQILRNPEGLVLPRTFLWPANRLAITITNDLSIMTI